MRASNPAATDYPTAFLARKSSMGRKLTTVLGLMMLGGIVTAVSIQVTPGRANLGQLTSVQEQARAPAAATTSAKPNWIAAAPGRVEPRNGMIRVGAAVPGRITNVLVRLNAKVSAEEVLLRLDDIEARARLAAAEAEAAARKRERDAQPGTTGREEIRKAEDGVYAAERALMSARFELDEMIAADRQTGTSGQSQARKRLDDAREKLKQEQLGFAMAQAKGAPAPNRFEAGLAAARAEVSMAEAQLEKTRVRAPVAGTVLQVNAKVGEMAAATPELPLIAVGDTSVLRVRAEVDEADVAKIKVGQHVIVRGNSHPSQEFEGKVSELAPSMGPPRMGSRGARRANDVEVMEVMIDLDGATPLLPGMRAEAFFR